MQLYIDGISPETAERDLQPLFAGVRSLQSLRVIRDIASGASRGFALATVSDEAEAKATIQRLNGSTFADGKLTVFRIHDTLPGEMEFREWMRDSAEDVLRRAGVVPGSVVVDYGCGPGIFSVAAARIAGPRGKVHALDVRQRALDELKKLAAEEGLTNLETGLLDRSACSVDLPDGAADAILLYDVLQEIANKAALMQEMSRLLKPAGVLSVFPMHLGTDALLDLVRSTALFRIRDRLGFPGWQTASEIVNLTKGSR
jgi:2-polyprenyl-3-methyl-5-hydroxy-6-metoxy-1,4-benzoquinol methylase